MSNKEGLEYYVELVNNDKVLRGLSEGLKYKIAYFDWTAYCDCGDASRPVSKLIKKAKRYALKDEIKWLQAGLKTGHIPKNTEWIAEGRISKLKERLKELSN